MSEPDELEWIADHAEQRRNRPRILGLLAEAREQKASGPLSQRDDERIESVVRPLLTMLEKLDQGDARAEDAISRLSEADRQQLRDRGIL